MLNMYVSIFMLFFFILFLNCEDLFNLYNLDFNAPITTIIMIIIYITVIINGYSSN